MDKSNKVLQEAGEYTLMFFQVNANRTHYKLMNDRSKNALQRMHAKTWHVAKKLMPAQTQFFCVAAKTVPGKGASGASFNIIGILSCYDTYDEAEEVSKYWRGKHKFLETNQEKVKFTRSFIQALQEFHNERGASCDFSAITMNKFLELTQND